MLTVLTILIRVIAIGCRKLNVAYPLRNHPNELCAVPPAPTPRPPHYIWLWITIHTKREKKAVKLSAQCCHSPCMLGSMRFPASVHSQLVGHGV